MNTAIRRAIGVISGTSMDGIDVSVVETDGDRVVKPGPGRTFPYPNALRRDLLDLIANPERARHDELRILDKAVTDAHAGAVKSFMQEQGFTPSDVALVGLHGQTVLHRPEERFTRQLGDGADAARQLGVDTVSRFRHADVAAGGEGAPFAPLYHRALAGELPGPLMVLNWGGVGNVTFIDGDEVVAFDTGPANALIDDWILKTRGVPYDADGALCASGTPDMKKVAAMMENPFFNRPPPKSLDRNDFHRRAQIVEGMSDADGAATLAAFTVEATAAALQHVKRPAIRWLVTGGGRLNAFLMSALAKRVCVPVEPVEAVGWNGDFIEAQCFGYLAVRSTRGLPLSLPTTTGVPRPMTGGELARAA
ncbi:anhydro-N-acetylmuramic acid kinase [Terrarubrum flagellatum]|uniref:anhydro-N-acetylmuramic acid kinase n=1 Tax=Terrirubrum flagellatum TaxID=2895980 RepID=UPI0031451839